MRLSKVFLFTLRRSTLQHKSYKDFASTIISDNWDQFSVARIEIIENGKVAQWMEYDIKDTTPKTISLVIVPIQVRFPNISLSPITINFV
jgi:hypothetical protein